LPTIQDFLEDSIIQVVTQEDRLSLTLLEVINVEKEIFLQPVSLEKNQDLKR
jgi:hypothetical protein